MDVTRLKAFGPGPGPGYDPQAAAPRTATRVEAGEARHLETHLKRLATSAAAAGTAADWLPAEAPALREWIKGSAREPLEVLRLRLHGSELWALMEPFVALPSPYRVRIAPHPLGAPGLHPLAPHKGLMGSWNLEALRSAQAIGAEDALLYWPGGTLVETAIASIALETGGELWLPPLEGRVASLAERLDVPVWAGEKPIRIQAFQAADLERGQLWCFNAVRGIWPGTLA